MAEPRGWIVLPALDPERAAAVLVPPRLPPAAAARVALARSAARLRIPVLVRAPAAGQRLLVARALHALAAPPGPLVACTGRRPALGAAPPAAAVTLDAGALVPEAALAVEALLDDGERWLLATAEPGSRLPPPLATRLGTVVLEIPPLAARQADLPALAAAVLAALARRAHVEAPPLGPDVLARLAAHTWSGDIAELEAVLARAWLVAGSDPIGADHLALEEPHGPARARVALAPDPALELLLAELAHEVRNPLVTVKTFAEHLPDMLEDAALRDRFAALTREGIGRIDALLENVIEFARLGPPCPEPIAVGPLLDRLLAEVEPDLAGRAVRVRRGGDAGARCTGDPAHVAYALRNLFAGVIREVPPREELALDASVNGVVTVRFATGGEAAAHLRRLAAGDGGALTDPALLPLAFRLARTVLERNGGGLAVLPEADNATTLVVRLPNVEGG